MASKLLKPIGDIMVALWQHVEMKRECLESTGIIFSNSSVGHKTTFWWMLLPLLFSGFSRRVVLRAAWMLIKSMERADRRQTDADPHWFRWKMCSPLMIHSRWKKKNCIYSKLYDSGSALFKSQMIRLTQRCIFYFQLSDAYYHTSEENVKQQHISTSPSVFLLLFGSFGQARPSVTCLISIKRRQQEVITGNNLLWW